MEYPRHNRRVKTNAEGDMDLVIGNRTNPAAVDHLIGELKSIQLTDASLYVGYPILATADQSITMDAILTCVEHGIVVFDLEAPRVAWACADSSSFWVSWSTPEGMENQEPRAQGRTGNKSVSQTGSGRGRTPVTSDVVANPGTNLIHEHMASVRKRSPRPAAAK